MNLSNEHEKIRSLLSMAAAGILDPAEEVTVENHVRNCPECAAQLEHWQALARGLRRLPTPRLSPVVLQRTLALAREAQAAARERLTTLRVLIPLVALSWLLTVFSWPLFKIASGGLRVMLGINFGHDWRVFAFFVGWTWLAAGVAAAMLSSYRQRLRRSA